MKFNIETLIGAGALTLAFSSCGTSDTEPPTLCQAQNLTGLPSVTLDEIEVESGTSVTVFDAFCDDTELGEVRWDLHSAEGHEHEEGEEEGFVLNSGTDWAELETRSLEGTSAEEGFTFDVPLTARGIWDLVVSVVDAEGNAAPDFVSQIHVENDHIPEFVLGQVDGVSPDTWESEPVWSPGSSIVVSGAIRDSDGIAEAELLLILEADESTVWSSELQVSGDSLVFFTETVVIPADAVEGAYHFEMKATDGTGVEMHTGFHVEVE